jgi:hypothetical protein
MARGVLSADASPTSPPQGNGQSDSFVKKIREQIQRGPDNRAALAFAVLRLRYAASFAQLSDPTPR